MRDRCLAVRCESGAGRVIALGAIARGEPHFGPQNRPQKLLQPALLGPSDGDVFWAWYCG
jgi:hypothetical protein